MEKFFDQETIRQIRVLLSVQKALLGAVTPSLRSVNVSWDMNRIDIYFVYDGEISDMDCEEAECAATEVLANFPDNIVETHHIRCDYPKRTPAVGKQVVFRRKEA